MPQKTIGLTVRYPGKASFAGLCFKVTVSPTLASLTDFMEAAMYPTSPADNFSAGSSSVALKKPHSVTVKLAPVAINLISSPVRSSPSFTLT